MGRAQILLKTHRMGGARYSQGQVMERGSLPFLNKEFKVTLDVIGMIKLSEATDWWGSLFKQGLETCAIIAYPTG